MKTLILLMILSVLAATYAAIARSLRSLTRPAEWTIDTRIDKSDHVRRRC